MGRDLDVPNVLVSRCIDDCHQTVVFPGILASVPHVDPLGIWIVYDAVGSEFQLQGVEKFQSVAMKHYQHPVIATGHEQLVEGRDVQNPLGLLESWNAACPPPLLKVDNFHRAILKSGNEKPLAVDVHPHMVEAAFDLRYSYCLNQPQGRLLLPSWFRTLCACGQAEDTQDCGQKEACHVRTQSSGAYTHNAAPCREFAGTAR